MSFTIQSGKPYFSNKASLWLDVLQFRCLRGVARFAELLLDKFSVREFLRPRSQRLRKVN
jgi:hypothetical protein